jgi:hypothetical protein
MSRVSTLPAILVPLMDGESVETPFCAVCGRPWPLNRHHIVRRGAGRLYRDGVEVPKPTIVLCGLGNNLADADGRPFCHGLAHANRLHFRWVASPEPGHWEYVVLREPTSYARALEMGGWRPLRRWRWCR